jgi:hypothetical protein
MNLLTQEKIKELLDYNPETGIFIWKSKTSKYSPIKVGSIAGYLKSSGYRIIEIYNKAFREHRLAWLYVYGVFPSDQIDHINGIRDDNRISNLREATNKENSFNKKPSKNNTSGYKGVSWNKKNNKWVSQIRVDKKSIYLGLYDSLEDAAIAYQAAAIRYHGDFRKLD